MQERLANNVRSPESIEIMERIKIAAGYLERLDEFVQHVSIDEKTGKVTYNKPDLGDLDHHDQRDYQLRFTELLTKFRPKNEAYITKLKSQAGVLDAEMVMGAIVVTFDSSRGTPSFVSGKSRGEYNPAEDEGGETYLGLAPVDINPRVREDGVSPTTSAIHELHHHTHAIMNYLMNHDAALCLQSDHNGRNVALYGGGQDRVPTDQAYFLDKTKYEHMLGRQSDDETFANEEIPRLQRQQNYLDELHSSFLQKKANWFSAQENVYSRSGKGKHWEVASDVPEEQQLVKNMLGYLQGFYTLHLIAETWRQQKDKGQAIGPGQQQFIESVNEQFLKVGSLIGTARTIQQAEHFVHDAWNEWKTHNARVIAHPHFAHFMQEWNNKGGVENVASILGI